MQMLPSNSKSLSWETYDEDIYSLGDSTLITSNGLLEHLNVTRDIVEVSPSESFLNGGEWPTLSVESKGHAMHVFINGQLSGSAHGTRQNRRFTFTGKINLHAGTNRIALLSIVMGLMSFTERILSDAELSSSNFPYIDDPMVYTPSPTDVAEKVGNTTKGKFQLGRNVSIIQRKDYTSDEELESLLTPIIDKLSSSKPNGNEENASYDRATIRIT
ncbi:hypothetical protein GIB67_019290 [Kingdonia uniflora]|uniref:Beta-galactosidase n=1 Tax=Kingdonia uniflora TaxID=39325 RepID=A0A7J7MZZ9_9MAGN|nr:hypothetical protein GIB67_019290 [Kingdonia uniflora]